jgi:hypothetical protein
MNPAQVLLAVPVYRETEREYYSRLDQEDQRRLQVEARRMEKVLSNRSHSSEIADEIANSMPPNPDRKAWRYNRIVGWIEFYSDKRTIKARLWLAKGKRLRRNFKNLTIEYRGKIGDVCLAHKAGNSEILAALTNFMNACENGAYSWNDTKKYRLGKDILLRQLRFLDLCGLIEQIEKDMHHDR